jgi:hypothetical protein
MASKKGRNCHIPENATRREIKMSAKISGPFVATEYIDKERWTEAAVWGPDGDLLAHVHSNLGLDWAAIDVAQLFAGAPTAHALIERAVSGGIDDRWIEEARAYLNTPHTLQEPANATNNADGPKG